MVNFYIMALKYWDMLNARNTSTSAWTYDAQKGPSSRELIAALSYCEREFCHFSDASSLQQRKLRIIIYVFYQNFEELHILHLQDRAV